MLIGKRIKELRKEKNMTQSELGKLVNVTKVSISCYESGTRTPDLETFELLIKALETTPDYLLGRDKLVISEGEEKYKIFLPKEDLEIISEMNKNRELIRFLRNDPKRGVEYIVKKMN